MNEKNKNRIILAVTVIAVIQTFLDDYSQYVHSPVFWRNLFLFTNLFIDLIFSLEFILKTASAIKNKQGKSYFLSPAAGINFLASLALLFLNSGPSVLLLLTGKLTLAAGWLMRFTHILKLSRILKLIEVFPLSRARMTRKHVRIILHSTALVLLLFFIFTSFLRVQEIKGLITQRSRHYERTLYSIENMHMTMDIPLQTLLFKILSNDNYVLKLTYADFLVFSSLPPGKTAQTVFYNDSFILARAEYKLSLSLMDINQMEANHHLQYFMIMLILVLVILLNYSRYFDRNVSQVLAIVTRGIREKEDMSMVRTEILTGQDEMADLARTYNEHFLPAKQRQGSAEELKKRNVFTKEDLLNFIRKK
ncbi:MAG: hypothetical protein PHF84_09425 [bacterium]|nr:hypothetical protein [bacterium]